MSKELIRIWSEEDVAKIEKELLIVGESLGDCANCRHLGIDYAKAKECPECKVTFKYISSREATGTTGIRFSVVKKLRAKRPDLIIIDYEDFKNVSSARKAREFFK